METEIWMRDWRYIAAVIRQSLFYQSTYFLKIRITGSALFQKFLFLRREGNNVNNGTMVVSSMSCGSVS